MASLAFKSASVSQRAMTKPLPVLGSDSTRYPLYPCCWRIAGRIESRMTWIISSLFSGSVLANQTRAYIRLLLSRTACKLFALLTKRGYQQLVYPHNRTSAIDEQSHFASSLICMLLMYKSA